MSEQVERRNVIVEREQERSPWGIVGAAIVVLFVIFLLYALFNWLVGNNSGTTPVYSPSTQSNQSTTPSLGGATNTAPTSNQ